MDKGNYFRFGLIFIKKNNQIKFFKKKKTDWFRFGSVFLG